ncbi:MAG: prepilin-type N-terminal cleavage/methylation domain-containing protein [Actinomycetota bacterium]|nr:prepilin-type N-terminal cleavage/methylation domain-containing protein [Actinomycetota bacterium]
MRWPERFRADEGGFTLVELIISMAIVGLLISAIGSALIVSLRTTGVTNKRMAESHDVQITSAYLANDVQGASNVSAPNVATNCSGAFTTLVTFTYPTTGNPTALYKCGTAANGETQVTRTFAGGTPVVVAHFAGTARPNVTVTYDPAQPAVPVSVTMRFTKASDCTLDCTYTLFGSRRSFNPTSAGTGGSSPADVVLLSTGASSPLWVQGSCPDPGTTLGCIIDPAKTALPISDVTGFTANWAVAPLWNKLNDADASTFVTSAAGTSSEARVLMAAVDPPDPSVTPTLEFNVSAATGTGSTKVTLSIYDGSTLLRQSSPIGPINQPKNYDWTLTAAEASSIPTSAYAHLTLGFAVTTAKASNAQSISVSGVALDTLDVSAVGLLTIRGPLYVNSQISNAVRLTGTKNATKISIINGGDFQIWNPGACSGCNQQTVTCAACSWIGPKPWTNYSQSIPDPLRALPAPDPATLGTGSCNGSGVCQPGVYPTFSRTSNTVLNPGIYYLQGGLSVQSATLTCASPCTGGVMLYIAAGSVSFTGNSSVNLPAPTAGIYKGIVMFQARTDTSALKFAGNSGSSTFCTMGGFQYGNCLNGIVYVPNATQVTLATGSASLTAKAIVAQNVKVSSSVTIG